MYAVILAPLAVKLYDMIAQLGKGEGGGEMVRCTLPRDLKNGFGMV